ncbi:MAG: hypothetical protein ACFFEK_08355 [Candidatus Thorarchaeota archaeon]
MANNSKRERSVKGQKVDDLIKMLMVVSLIIIVSGTAFILAPSQQELPIFDSLSPSNVLPSQDSFWVNVGNLSISARISCYVTDTHRSDSFEVTLNLRINNTGPSNIVDFHPVKLSIFNDDNWHYFTFGLVPSTNRTIEALSNVSLLYEGDRILDTIEGIAESGYVIAYGRVLISFSGYETIITTSTYEHVFPIE